MSYVHQDGKEERKKGKNGEEKEKDMPFRYILYTYHTQPP